MAGGCNNRDICVTFICALLVSQGGYEQHIYGELR
jgi:hypothetical protein